MGRHLASSQEFFANVDEQHLRLHPGAPSLPQLKQLKEHFVASGVAWKKFDEYFRILFPTGFVPRGSVSSLSIEQSKKLGWLTFCMAKCLVLGTNSALLAGALPRLVPCAGDDVASTSRGDPWRVAAQVCKRDGTNHRHHHHHECISFCTITNRAGSCDHRQPPDLSHPLLVPQPTCWTPTTCWPACWSCSLRTPPPKDATAP
jgi:hypothetical protein